MRFNEDILRPSIYLDVDGVFVVPDMSSCEQNSVSVKYVQRPEHVSDEQIPTGKDSWKHVRLKYADEAKECLRLLALSGAQLMFLTTHPEWSVRLMMRRLELVIPYQMVESVYPQSFLSHVHHKASAIKVHNWSWIEDGLQPEAEKYLKDRNQYQRYVEVDPCVGITLDAAWQAIDTVFPG